LDPPANLAGSASGDLALGLRASILEPRVAVAGRSGAPSRSAGRLIRYLPRVMIATTLVAVCPVVLVWTLRVEGVLRSAPLTILLGIVLSIGTSYVVGLVWKSRSDSGDILFSELMLWGWLRRWRIERQLESAQRLLEGLDSSGELSRERRAKLLATLAAALESGDPYTHSHSRRVARHATRIAKRMGLSPVQVAKVRTAAALHDVGKINTPTAVLHKPGRLTDAEYDVIKRHPGDGAAMVEKLGDPELTAMVRHHHERLDGTGYPNGLASESIPLGARIIAVADTFDAITSTRPYRPANPHKKAIDILTREAGTQLDPASVHAFQSHYAGRRALGLWLALTKIPEGLAAWLSGGVNAAASASQVIAATAMTGAIASAAVTAPIAQPAAARHPRHGAAASVSGRSHAGQRAHSTAGATVKLSTSGGHRHPKGVSRHANGATHSSGRGGAGQPSTSTTGARGTGRPTGASNAAGGSPASSKSPNPSSSSTPAVNSGNSGSAPGKSSSPGNSGSAPGKSSSPGNSGSAPGKSSSPTATAH